MVPFAKVGSAVVSSLLLAGVLVVAEPASGADAAPTEPLLTAKIDDYADYDGADTCSPWDKPGAVALLDMLSAAYPGTGGYISRECSGPATSEHNEGRAVDWMISADSDRELADDFFDWLFATDAYGNPNAMVRRLGIMYVIWDREVWRAYDPGEGWQPYSGSSPHTDHVHISMSWDGAWQETTWTTGVDAGRLLDQARFAATWRDEGRLDVFRRGQSGALETRTWQDSWSGWSDLGGDLSSGPAAVWSSRKKLWVFAQGVDGTLVRRRWREARGWGNWRDTGVPITAAPGVTARDGQVDLFVRTPSGSLSYRSWVPKNRRNIADVAPDVAPGVAPGVAPDMAGSKAGWSRWKDLGGILSAPPAAAWSTPHELDVFVRGMAGLLHQKVFTGGQWSQDWITLGGVLTSGPSALSPSRGEVSVYVRTERGSISELTHVGSWSAWVDLGGMHVSGPSATAVQRVRRDLFTRDRGGGLAQNYSLSGSGWSGWALR